MPQKVKQEQLKTKIRIIISTVSCILIFLFIGQKVSLEAQNGSQTTPEKRYEPELVIQTGHPRSVDSVAFSPDGKTLASSGDRTIKLWNIETGKEIKSLKGHIGSVTSVTFSPDGKTLAGIDYDGTINLWHVETGGWIISLEGHTNIVMSVAFSPDGKILASGSYDKTIKLWNVETGKEIKSLKGHTDIVNSVAFSPDGKTLASGSFDGTIKLWNAKTGKEIKSLKGNFVSVESVAFSPDGKTLTSVETGGTIQLWNVLTGKEVNSLKERLSSVTFSPDGKTLASGSLDGTIKLWNAKTGKEIKSLKGYIGWVSRVTFSPDGKTLAGSSADTIKLWNVESGNEIKLLKGHTNFVNSVAFSPDGKTLASGSFDKTIKLWNVETGNEIKSLKGHIDPIDSVAFSPDGKTLASGSFDTIKLWNIENGKEMKSFKAHLGWVSSNVFVKYSPDGKTLVSIGMGGYENTIKLWNVETGVEIRTLEDGTFPTPFATFLHEGKTLVSTSSDKSESTILKWWNVENGKEIKSLKGQLGWITSGAFSPDGKTLVSGDKDGTIKLWNIENGKEIKSLKDHTDMVDLVTFSPNGKIFFSTGLDSTIKVWNKDSDQPVATLISLDNDDWVVTTPDGRFDTNKNLDSIESLIWVLPDAPLTPVPLEIFMRDYYEPKLLSRLIKCNEENNCDKEFAPLPNITQLNRVQPDVKITNISQPDINNKIKVSVEVSRGVVPASECKMKKCQSDVFDLRLFRDGQLVGTYPSDGQEKLIQQRDYEIKDSEKRKELWRTASKIALDPKTGKKILTFDVQLPKSKTASQVEFTAYSFNDDRVKSKSASKLYDVPASQTVAKGRAYILNIGVNANQIPKFKLNYAANDVKSFQDAVVQRLPKDKYEDIVDIQLLSDYKKDASGQIILTENRATKANVKAVLDLLSGKNDKVPADVLKEIPNAARIKKAQPEDTVIIYFSGHGYADQNGIFYLVPYDTGDSLEKGFATILSHCISSDELSLWLRDVDAMEMMMIVDACHSAAAVQGKDFKPGPMGSRGLGQLSYDKGMRILTATQADNIALELGKLEHSLLTYSLIKNGLEMSKADYLPKDNSIQSAEWLNYAVTDTPDLYKAVKEGNFQLIVQGQVATKEKAKSFLDEDEKQSNVKLQQPSLFDFSRRRREFILFRLN